jgi:hypothetical protein
MKVRAPRVVRQAHHERAGGHDSHNSGCTQASSDCTQHPFVLSLSKDARYPTDQTP